MSATRYIMAHYTDRGRRPVNEDAVLVSELDADRTLVAVADGMGGHLAGEVASQRALQEVLAEARKGTDVREAVAQANRCVYEEASRVPERRGMGTTLVVLLRDRGSYEVANVGDSRAYRIDAEGIAQVTHDHSFVAEAVRDGRLSHEEAAASPWRNALTRAVGTDPDVDVDLFGPFPTRDPHVVLLCSDGLYKVLEMEQIRNLVVETEDLQSAVESLGNLAYRRHSDDNITIAAIEFGSLRRGTGAPSAYSND